MSRSSLSRLGIILVLISYDAPSTPVTPSHVKKWIAKRERKKKKNLQAMITLVLAQYLLAMS